MKCMCFITFPPAKMQEMAGISDKFWANPPEGIKPVAHYLCQGAPFADIVPGNFLVISVIDVDSNEALAQIDYPLAQAGARIRRVPVLEMPVGAAIKEEEKLRAGPTQRAG